MQATKSQPSTCACGSEVTGHSHPLTLGEVLVKPAERNDEALCQRYERAINGGASVLPFGISAAAQHGEIRQDRTIRPSDAVHLACAASVGMDLFITTNNRLPGRTSAASSLCSHLARRFSEAAGE